MPKKAARDDKDEEQDLQRKYMQMQIIRQQLGALLEEKKALDEKRSELSMTVGALKRLPDIGQKEEMWSTLGSGTFVRSDIKDTDKVFIAVGAGVVLKKTVPEGITILSSRLEELQNFESQVITEINNFSQAAERLERELEHAAQNR